METLPTFLCLTAYKINSGLLQILRFHYHTSANKIMYCTVFFIKKNANNGKPSEKHLK